MYCLYWPWKVFSETDEVVILSRFKSSSQTVSTGRLRLKCDGTRAETKFRLSAKRTSPFKSAGASVQSTTGSRGVRISGSNAAYTMFRGCVKSTGYPLHSPVSPSLPLPCVAVCHHISTGVYHNLMKTKFPIVLYTFLGFFILEDCSDRFTRNVDKYQPTLRNSSEKRRYTYSSVGQRSRVFNTCL